MDKNKLARNRIRKDNSIPAKGGKNKQWASKGGKSDHYILAGILIYTAALYSGSLSNGFVTWDDYQFIFENTFIRNFSWQGIKDIFSSPYALNYQPLTTITWLMEYKLEEFRPFIYHFTNLFLHLVNVSLVFILIGRLSGNTKVALLSAFIFAIHPMHVESVAWVSERKDVLYTLFYLLSLILYIYYICQNFQTRFLIFSLISFLFSLLSKSMAVTLPLVMILIDYYYFDRKILSFRNFIEKVPFFILAILFSIINFIAQRSGGGLSDLSVMYSFYNRIFIISYGLSFYIAGLIFPFNLSVLHRFPDENSGFLPFEYYLSLLFILFLVWIVIRFGKNRKYLSFGLLFFLFTLLPVLQLIPVGKAVVSERYSYVPVIGIILIIFTLFVQDKVIIRQYKLYLLFVFAILSIYYSVTTWNRIKVWQNGITLWSEFVSRHPDYYYGYYGLGGAYGKFQNYQSEIDWYNKCIELNPTFYKAWCDRGMAKDYLNDMPGAMSDYNRTIELRPDNAEAYNNRAVDYYKMKKFNEALADYNKSLTLNPDNPLAYMNRALVYLYFNDKTKACEDMHKALALRYSKAQEIINQICR